ncbi:MAG: helix-turn-helix domain-containing protein [Oscillospiraceae bacterium]|nr:helix-turn-helix domain-containing protein [Oscillospiraceae bacterium]
MYQQQIADVINVSQTTYSGYERGYRSISVDMLEKLADFYGTSVDYLLFRTDVKAPYPKSRKLELLLKLEE